MGQHEHLYTDDRSTGHSGRPALRGDARITIAARWPLSADLDWLKWAINQVEIPFAEAKSEKLLEGARSSQQLHDLIYKKIHSAVILIFDPADHLRDLVRIVVERLDGKLDYQREVEALLLGRKPAGMASEIIRQFSSHIPKRSAFSGVDRLLREAACSTPLAVKTGPSLFDQNALQEMTTQERRVFEADFASALGDVLDPKVRSKALAKKLRGAGPWERFRRSELFMTVISEALVPDHTFDRGHSVAFANLQKCQEVVVETLRSSLPGEADHRTGTWNEGNSKELLGLKAADVAVNIGSQLFEHSFADSITSAKRVRGMFSRVMLSDRWIRRH